jgi:hypothetical protein
MEAFWNEGQHFSTVRKKLDSFPTFGGFAEIESYHGPFAA